MNNINTKRIVTIISFFVVLYILSFFIRFPFFSIQNIEAIPSNTLAFVELPNTFLKKDSIQKTAIVQQFNQWSIGEKIGVDLEVFGHLFGENIHHLKPRKISIAIANGKADEIDFLYVLDGLKKKYLLKNNAKEYTYLDQPIYEIQLGEERYSYTFYRNLLLFARYSVIVEDAINQLEKRRTNLYRNTAFKEVYKKKITPKDIVVYTNPSQLTSSWKPYFKKNVLASMRTISDQNNWTRIVIEKSENDLNITAESVPTASNHHSSNLRKCGKVAAFSLPKTFPNNTSFFQLDAYKDYHFIKEDQKEVFNKYFKSWIGQNIAFLMTEPYNQNYNNEHFMVLDATDNNMAQTDLWMTSIDSKLEYMSYEIGQIDLKFSLPSLFGFRYESMSKPYFTILDQQVVFAHNVNSLKGLLDKYTVNQTLSNDADFIQLWNQSTTKHHSMTFIHPKLNSYFMDTFIKDKKGKPVGDLINIFSKQSPILLTTNILKKKNQIQVLTNKNTSNNKNTSIAWRTALEAETIAKPKLVQYQNQTAIIVQDENYQVYLLNKNGKIIWKKQLNAAILSDIFELDYYQNGKNNYLFNTKHKIYLVDNNGEDVRGYPFGLKSPMSNGLIAIDFDGTKQFDYFVACENRNVYGFDQQGKPLSGWNPNFNNGIIRQNFKHFQYQNKDYIISINTGSKLQVHQRNGKPRFNPVFLKNSTAFDFENTKYSTRIVAKDQGSRIRVINPEGASFRIGLCQSTDQINQFAFADIIGDKRNDYIQLIDSTVCCKYYENTTLKDTLNYTYEYVQDTIFGVPMNNSDKSFLGSVNSEKAQISLLNNQGELCANFPLAGTTPFVVTDLFQNQQNILIVGNGASVYAYQLSE